MKYTKKNINGFINDQFNCIQVDLMRINEKPDEQSSKNEYSEKF